MPKAKRQDPADRDDIPETDDITELLNEPDREAYEARKERKERHSEIFSMPDDRFLCPNDDTVLRLRGIFRYMHHENTLSTGEHWECDLCGYTEWKYLPPSEVPSEFPDGFPF